VKKIIGILLTMILIMMTFGIIVHAQEESDPGENELLKFETHNWHRYTPPGDTFTNGMVDGSMFWFVNASNQKFEPWEAVAGLEATLNSTLEFTWYPILISDPEISILSYMAAPPLYHWEFSDVGAGADVTLLVHPVDPGDSPVTYEPGFNITRWVDKTVFSPSGETQTQKLIIVITPREDYVPGLTNNILIQVAADENFLIPTGTDYDSVEAAFIPPADGSAMVIDDGHLLMIPLAEWQTGKPLTFEVEVIVTPLAEGIEYVPTVWAFEVVESHEFHPVVEDNSIEFDQPVLGTWTWQTYEDHWLWLRTNIMLKGVTFSSTHPGIETFNIESMFIDFGEEANTDEITITEATFSLAGDTVYDLATDVVTVIVDGVEINIPAGSFHKIGGTSSQRYIYNSKGAGFARVQMVIDFDEGNWSLIARGINAGLIDNDDGVTVVFAIGDSAAIERIDMQIGNLTYTAAD